MATAYLGIGSNQGDRQANIERALALLKEIEEIKVLKISKIIESEFEGAGPEQGKFLNGAAQIQTGLLPLDLLSRLKMVERRLGRVKTGTRNAPRPMDLDILLYDDVVIVDGRTLCVPHPRLHERRFVLEPLAEIAPELVHPRLGKTIQALYQDLLHASPSKPPGA